VSLPGIYASISASALPGLHDGSLSYEVHSNASCAPDDELGMWGTSLASVEKLCVSVDTVPDLKNLGSDSAVFMPHAGVSLVAIAMGLNLLELLPVRLPSLDVDVRTLQVPPILQVCHLSLHPMSCGGVGVHTKGALCLLACTSA